MSKPTREQLAALCPDADARLIEAHLTRLEDPYFARFGQAEVAAHVRGLARLSPQHPVEVMLKLLPRRHAEVTVLAFDYPAEFSLITGVLAGMGFGVISGDIFTYEKAAATSRPALARGGGRRPAPIDPYRRRRIIDHFSGRIFLDQPMDDWSRQLRERLGEVLGYLEQGERSAVEQAKHRVNELVTERLAFLQRSGHPVLYPVQIQIHNRSRHFTRIHLVSQDTPAFLYTMSTALSLQGLSIEHVRIRTIRGRIEDEVDVTDLAGRSIRDREKLDKIKLSMLFTKQFSYFLDRAPDPYTALTRFEHLLEEITRLPDRRRYLTVLSNPHSMRNLARVLGTSDILWEDFIRLQYESLLPILKPRLRERRLSTPPARLGPALARALAGAGSFEEKIERLNVFKDSEIFHIDLDHILNPRYDFRWLSDHLTRLAEQVAQTAAALVYQRLIQKHGRPRSVAGLEAAYAIVGLGKLGGAALGYASDIELMFVYSDSGQTDGADPIENGEFFGHLAMETAHRIEAKREGIFHVDLRLRPYGQSGPAACSLQSFVSYYGPGGPAHSYERLALVRLRAIGGDAELGARIERLRDDFIYASPAGIHLNELRDLRIKQFREKSRGQEYNAKFSPGALVDLEYTVQILQVMHARDVPALRTPRIHEAIEALRKAGVLSPAEGDRLAAAYDFLRRLINGLRMLRGSALDLFLPPIRSDEFIHLARRMGYEEKGDLDPARQLFVDFELTTATVRTFVEHHLGRASIPGPAMGNVADLVLSDEAPAGLPEQVLRDTGFQDTGRAYRNLRSLAGGGARRDAFARLAVLAGDMLDREPDPDMALNNWERFVQALERPADHFQRLLAQPRRLHLLLAIFSRSQYLADLLIRNPDHFDWVTDAAILHKKRTRRELEGELRGLARRAKSADAWRLALRRFRHREMLRIGARDMCLGLALEEIVADLTLLAESIIEVALEQVWARRQPAPRRLEQRFGVLAFGKLGGRELNYSSDVDLLGVYRAPAGHRDGDHRVFIQVMEQLRHDLSAATEEGHAFRVDLRLRPYGRAGELVSSLGELESYYRKSASLWEVQALLKLRAIAGNQGLGQRLLRRIRPLIVRKRGWREIFSNIQALREAAIKTHILKPDAPINIKVGLGGIRDIEFLVQGLQLIHAHRHPDLLTGHTLDGLRRLERHDILAADTRRQLEQDYIYLRRVEHYLQILEDRQTHSLPSEEGELTALARRMMGRDGTAAAFTEELNLRLRRVHETYNRYIAAH
jgi:glutamate-ammonia-ligase adenylyltransferase